MGHKAQRALIPLIMTARFKLLPILRIKVKSRAEVEEDIEAEQELRKAEATRLLSKLVTGPIYGDGDI